MDVKVCHIKDIFVVIHLAFEIMYNRLLIILVLLFPGYPFRIYTHGAQVEQALSSKAMKGKIILLHLHPEITFSNLMHQRLPSFIAISAGGVRLIVSMGNLAWRYLFLLVNKQPNPFIPND